jgi:hypothetical protein
VEERQTHRRNSNPCKNQRSESTHEHAQFDAPVIHDICQTDPDLAAVVVVWPRLPRPLREAVLVLIRTASEEVGR